MEIAAVIAIVFVVATIAVAINYAIADYKLKRAIRSMHAFNAHLATLHY